MSAVSEPGWAPAQSALLCVPTVYTTVTYCFTLPHCCRHSYLLAGSHTNTHLACTHTLTVTHTHLSMREHPNTQTHTHTHTPKHALTHTVLCSAQLVPVTIYLQAIKLDSSSVALKDCSNERLMSALRHRPASHSLI